MVKLIALLIWNLSEWSGVGLGKSAPYVFGLMAGAKSMKKIERDGNSKHE